MAANSSASHITWGPGAAAAAATHPALLLLLLVLLATPAGAARQLRQGDEAPCSAIPHCTACHNARTSDGTVLLCDLCDREAGYTLAASARACDCAPGFFHHPDTPAGECAACAAGGDGAFYCPGGPTTQPADAARIACGDGFRALFPTASRAEHCVCLPGFGLETDTTAAPCGVGEWSSGGTRNPCTPCRGGLTTRDPAAPGGSPATSPSDCLAPAGSYLNGAYAQPCPRGTYTTGLNRDRACTLCPPGTTTADTQSTSPADCAYARSGFKLTAQADRTAETPAAAAPCDLNTYAPVAHQGTLCTSCDTNLITRTTGARGAAACVAPPGVGFASGTAAPCPEGSFKAGFSRRPCVTCGAGFRTNGAGKTSAAACYVPRGFGTVRRSYAAAATVASVGTASDSLVEAAADGLNIEAYPCVNGSYGATADTYGIADVPCTPCPAGTTSGDVPGENTNYAACFSLPGYGMDAPSGMVVQCERGTWAAGGSLTEECTPCPVGYTTLQPGSNSSDACVIAPGWGATPNGPEPCVLGTYGAGGSADAICEDCPRGSSSEEPQAGALSDCYSCAEGYGDNNGDPLAPACERCPPGTWSAGGSRDCTACPDGFTSAPGSAAGIDCVPAWQQLPVPHDTVPTPAAITVAGPADAASCKTACAAAATASPGGCLLYAWNATDTTCRHVPAPSASAAGTGRVGFKAGPLGSTYSVSPWVASEPLGVELTAADAPAAVAAAAAAASPLHCSLACDMAWECIAVVWQGVAGSCSLRRAAMNADVRGCEFLVEGARFNTGWD